MVFSCLLISVSNCLLLTYVNIRVYFGVGSTVLVGGHTRMFLSLPRASVAKPSGSQLLRFGTLFHKISDCVWKSQWMVIHWLFQTQSQNSPLFPPRRAMFPTLLYASASDSSLLEFVRYINSIIMIIPHAEKHSRNEKLTDQQSAIGSPNAQIRGFGVWPHLWKCQYLLQNCEHSNWVGLSGTLMK